MGKNQNWCLVKTRFFVLNYIVLIGIVPSWYRSDLTVYGKYRSFDLHAQSKIYNVAKYKIDTLQDAIRNASVAQSDHSAENFLTKMEIL